MKILKTIKEQNRKPEYHRRTQEIQDVLRGARTCKKCWKDREKDAR